MSHTHTNLQCVPSLLVLSPHPEPPRHSHSFMERPLVCRVGEGRVYDTPRALGGVEKAESCEEILGGRK